MNNPTPAEIRAAREAAGLTQAQAAELVHASARNWQQWEQTEATVKNSGPFRWIAGNYLLRPEAFAAA